MSLSRATATLRYLTSLGLACAVIALSVMFLLEAPASVRDEAPPTIATFKSASQPSSLPLLKASDFDVARAVPVVITGKANPVTIAAPLDANAEVSANLQELGKQPAQGQATVSADAVNVRARPSTGSTKLSVVRSGQVVDVLESKGGWSRIAGRDGASGWMATKFLQR